MHTTTTPRPRKFLCLFLFFLLSLNFYLLHHRKKGIVRRNTRVGRESGTCGRWPVKGSSRWRRGGIVRRGDWVRTRRECQGGICVEWENTKWWEWVVLSFILFRTRAWVPRQQRPRCSLFSFPFFFIIYFPFCESAAPLSFLTP